MVLHGYIPRIAENSVAKLLQCAPVIAILGPRQCGKSTLAHHYLQSSQQDFIFLDLQDRADRNKLTEPEIFLEYHRHRLVCFDEVQQLPDLFSYLRVEVDRDRRPGRFIILGSASRDLIQQSTETLAGRIAFLDLTPFLINEVKEKTTIEQFWLRGGFPDSLLAANDNDSYRWRNDFIRTFLERDIPQLGFAIPVKTMERLWRLLAHYHGQAVNYSKIAASSDLSIPTLKRYINLLEQTYMVRLLHPYEPNIKKRLIKAPKIYLRDSGILHALQGIEFFDDLMSHPINGASWEGFAIENIIAAYPQWQPFYLRTSNGAEIDLVLVRGQKKLAIECKLSKAPQPSRGFYQLIEDIKPQQTWLVAPVTTAYPLKANIQVTPLQGLCLPGV